MSSTTAAPSTVRAPGRLAIPSSRKVAEVMPALVAARAAPRKTLVSVLSPRARPSPRPPRKGRTTPALPTATATRPTARISESRVSRPTQKSRKTTPSSEKTSSTSFTSTQPSTAGPISTPPRISPTIAGCPIRLKTSSPSLAASRTRKRSVRTPAASAAAIGRGAGIAPQAIWLRGAVRPRRRVRRSSTQLGRGDVLAHAQLLRRRRRARGRPAAAGAGRRGRGRG